MPVWWIFAYLMTISALAVDLALYKREKRRRYLRVLSIANGLFLLSIYSVILFGDPASLPYLRGGLYTALGVSVWAAIHIADSINSCRD
jgi:hypothetical protein